MATRQNSFPRSQPALDTSVVRWVAGIGSALVLLILVAVGAAPERQSGVVEPGEVVTGWAERTHDCRGQWLGYTRGADALSNRSPVRGLLQD